MSFEIPIVTKCCFCIPIRRGLLVLGYLGLLCSLFSLGFTGAILDQKLNVPLEDGNRSRDLIECAIFLTQFIIDLCFNIVLLVGAHRTNALLVRIYYYYGIVSLILSVIFTFGFFVYGVHWIQFVFTMPAALITMYLLIVIRSAYIKFGRDHPVKYSANNEDA